MFSKLQINKMRLSILSTAVTIFCLYFFQKAQFPKLNEAFVPANIEAEECLTDLYLQQQLAMSPSFKKEHEKTEEQALRFFRSYYGRGEKSLLGGFTLPIVIHVIHQNGPENVPDWQIIQAIEWLNDGFENINYYDQGVGVNTGIQFCLAKRDPDGNATSGINRVQSPLTNVTDDLAMKNLSRWDPTRYINIWLVADANGAGGYSTLPASHGSPTDGIVMKAEKIMNVGSGHSTMIHEMGHYLGLNHTFNGGCTNNDCLVDGDKVCDTPPDGSTAPPPACSISINSCNTDTNSGFPTDQDDLTWNYVDYGNYSCRAGYTQGQADRMCYFIENVRSSLLNTDACLDPCPNPFIASFNSSATDIMLGETVNFLNTSTGGNNYEWQIDGNVFSNNTNANYVFNTGAGDFVISLMATVADPNCTEIYYDTVHVECPAVASFTAMNLETVSGGTIGFINNSSNANNYEWLIDGVVFSTNTNASYTFPSVGRYKITLIATDISGLCQEEYSLFVNVSCMAASFTSSDLFPAPGDNVGFINTSQGGNSYTWTINGNIESNNTDFSFSFPNAGVFSVCLEGVNGNCEDVFCQELFVFESGGGECEGTFVRRIGNSLADEQAYFLLPYKNGNFIIGGRDDTRSILLEVDASGNILTQRAIDFTNGNDFIRYLIVDSESYLIGATRDQPDASTVNHVFKYDFENDDFIWVR
ncbi:MAG TPA: hypothetical protein ENJ95_01320, partial [Bacteroidetes bacterium]|nr:hypothetical protein [Bacteroidota bacterium]